MTNNTAKEPSLYLGILSYSAPVLALAALLSYGYTTVYYSGYLRAFDIDIRMVDFFPKIADITVWGVVSCTGISIIIVLLALSLYGSLSLSNKVGNFLASRYKKLRWLKSDKNESIPRPITTSIMLTLILVSAFVLVYFTSDKQGHEAGKTQSNFVVETQRKDSTDLKVLIYQNGDMGVFKPYDKSTKTFGDIYSIESIEDKTFRSVLLDRK